MIVDCMTCPVRCQRCDDCAVTVLRPPGSAIPSAKLLLDAAENSAVAVFVGAGLVNAEAAAGLHAIRETMDETLERWGPVHAVG